MSTLRASPLVRAIRYPMFLTAVALCGCSRNGDDGKRFVPDRALAEAALTRVLQAKVDALPPPEKLESGPGLIVVDTHSKPNSRAVAFRICGERPTDTGRMFVVDLTWQDVAEPERTHYVVLGIDPLLVFRLEDLDMISHWDHVMESPEK